MTSDLDRVLDAVARGETPQQADPADQLLVDVASQLFRAARSIEPPAGAFGRAVAGAVLPVASRPWTIRLLRPALAVTLSLILAGGLGTAAYASTPGESLYPIQRRLDDLYLGVPRPPAEAARAYRAVADRRVVQAAGAADRVSPDLLRSVLDDAARYLRDARGAVQRAPAGERRELLQAVLETQRSAKARLSEAGQQAGPDQRGQIGQFEESIQHDIDAEERELEEDDGSGSSPAAPSGDRPAADHGSVVPMTSGRSDGGPAGGDPVTQGGATGRGAGPGAGPGASDATAQHSGQSGSPGPDGTSGAGGTTGASGASDTSDPVPSGSAGGGTGP